MLSNEVRIITSAKGVQHIRMRACRDDCGVSIGTRSRTMSSGCTYGKVGCENNVTLVLDGGPCGYEGFSHHEEKHNGMWVVYEARVGAVYWLMDASRDLGNIAGLE